jgi:Fur family ferric uptake transcriptional regulator
MQLQVTWSLDDMEDVRAVAERRLRSAQKRITPQRRLILDILVETEGHLDAHDIYDQARRQDTRLSLSTVYRTLAVLKETGVVRELYLDRDHHHYELDDKDEHSHLVCLSCGRIVEVDSAPFAEAALTVGESYGFEIASAQVELAGYCARCRISGQE